MLLAFAESQGKVKCFICVDCRAVRTDGRRLGAPRHLEYILTSFSSSSTHEPEFSLFLNGARSFGFFRPPFAARFALRTQPPHAPTSRHSPLSIFPSLPSAPLRSAQPELRTDGRTYPTVRTYIEP